MSTDYNYDTEGAFYPFFILTISSLITLPLSYSLLKPSKGTETLRPVANQSLLTGKKN